MTAPMSLFMLVGFLLTTWAGSASATGITCTPDAAYDISGTGVLANTGFLLKASCVLLLLLLG